MLQEITKIEKTKGSNGRIEAADMKKFREVSIVHLGFDFGEESSLEIQRGVAEGILKILQLSIAQMSQLLESMRDLPAQDWENVQTFVLLMAMLG